MAFINKGAILDTIEKTQLRDDLPTFSSGDTVSVHMTIKEGAKTRIQKITGVILRVRGRGTSKTIIIRRETQGVWSEFSLMVNNPLIVKIEIDRVGKVRRSYISYFRTRSGKSARIKSGLKLASK